MLSKLTPGVICFLTHIKTDFLHSDFFAQLYYFCAILQHLYKYI